MCAQHCGITRDTAANTGLDVVEVFKMFHAHMEAVIAQPSSYKFRSMGRNEKNNFRQQKFEGALLQQETEASVAGGEDAGKKSGQADGGYAGGSMDNPQGGKGKPREVLEGSKGKLNETCDGSKGKSKEASKGSNGKSKEVFEGDEWKKEKRKLGEKLDEERNETKHCQEDLPLLIRGRRVDTTLMRGRAW
ncbi:unnamed protein product [Closterium sp. Yama58-4]|nr:unnamed protein product [Closterium sp. Yama58-4]